MATCKVSHGLVIGLIFGCLAFVACIASAQQTEPDSNDGQILLHSFASGQKFYIPRDSFQPAGNGKLQYNVTSDTAPDGQRVSQNEIDCRTGQMKSPIHSWNQDSKDRQSDQKDGSSAITTLTNRTRLYNEMKDACQQAMPNLKMNW